MGRVVYLLYRTITLELVVRRMTRMVVLRW